MDRCEICGRRPAKQMTFKAHQGFIIFRRELEISGVFCRDHALEAYAAAQGKNLTGMWFSPDALVLGALRSLWDSAKLLDLPTEVTDAPWVPHKTACPCCQQAHVAIAGPVTCTKCRTAFVVVSCEKCQTVHAAKTDQSYDSIAIKSCRNCSHCTPAPFAARNSPILLLAFSITEIVGSVANVDGFVDPLLRMTHGDAIDSLFTFEPGTRLCIKNYYDRCVESPSLRFLLSCKEQAPIEFFQYVLAVSATILMADGAMERESIVALREIATQLGVADALDEFLGANDARQSDHGLEPSESWWEVLAVSPDANSDAIQAAYFALARQFHPDLWHATSEKEQQAAQLRMKAINAAFEQARSTVGRQSATDESARADARRRKAARRAAAQEAAKTEAARKETVAKQNATKEASETNPVNEERRTSRTKAARLQWWAVGATAILLIVVWIEVKGLLTKPSHIAVVPLPVDADQRKTESDNPNVEKESEEDKHQRLANEDAKDKEAQRLAEFGIKRAKEHRQHGEFSEALATLNIAIAYRESYEAHNIRGLCYAKLNRYRDAESDFSACIRLQSKFATAADRAMDYNNRGSARSWLSDFDGAIADFDAALVIDAGLPYAYAGRGFVRHRKGQNASAIDDFTTAIRLACDRLIITHPPQTRSVLQQKIAQMYRDRAVTYRAMGRYKEADDDEKNAKAWDSNASS